MRNKIIIIIVLLSTVFSVESYGQQDAQYTQYMLQKNSNGDTIGESWEISDVKGDASVVSKGEFQGKTLQELSETFQGALLGEKVYDAFGTKFPLLIKYIDAKSDLSIQVHPNDALAKERHNSFGKTEMWYVMQADEGAKLIVGFNQEVSKETYQEHLEKNTLTEILNFQEVKKGDVYFLPTGRIHAIGGGIVLAEIQQTSDITYRIYDWNRVDAKGNGRELHTALALDAIDYTLHKNYKTAYTSEANETTTIVDCPYFTTNLLPFEGEVNLNHVNVFPCFNIFPEAVLKASITNLLNSFTILLSVCLIGPISTSICPTFQASASW